MWQGGPARDSTAMSLKLLDYYHHFTITEPAMLDGSGSERLTLYTLHCM